jgi:16S rRNA (cytidine1402-2'-O)-methyltransferase
MSMGETRGVLYLVPNVLDADALLPEAVLPAAALSRIASLRHFVVEGERAAWRLLSRIMDKETLAAVTMGRLDEHSRPEDLPGLLAPALAGQDVGLLSEAGVPCVADPGGALVAAAHDAGIEVRPLVGPSSIILALAASGLDGQRFTFLGYLPVERPARRTALAGIDRGIAADGATRIFIETPYRNDRLLEDCLDLLGPETRLCVASSLTTASERIRSASVAEWRKNPGVIGKEPAIFLAGRRPGVGAAQPTAGQRAATARKKAQRHY